MESLVCLQESIAKIEERREEPGTRAKQGAILRTSTI